MPLQPTVYPPQLIEKLKVKIIELLNEGLIPLVSQTSVPLSISFMLDIQQLPIIKNVPLKTVNPEGVRVILASNNGVEAALDFYLTNDDINYTHSLAGSHLQEFIAALNALEQLYKTNKSYYHLACIDFHYATHPYLVVFNTHSAIWYNYFKDNILRLKPIDLKKQIGHLSKSTRKKTN